MNDTTPMRRRRRRLPALLLPALAVSLGACATATGAPQSAMARVAITQQYLVARCLDGRPVDSGERRWRLAPGRHVMRFTMRNAPREGTGGQDVDPGAAAVSFTVVAGGSYEVEVRAPTESYSRRVWTRGEWTPTVRQRDPDRVVSGNAAWGGGPCGTTPPAP